MYYNIDVVKDEEKQFAPLIIQGLRDSYDQILHQIASFSELEFYTEDITIDICAMQNGKYDACASGKEPSSEEEVALTQPSLAERDFRKLDTNGDGMVSLSELRIGLEKELQMDIPMQTFQTVMELYDKSGDGALQLNEFVTVSTFADSIDDNNNGGLASWAIALIVIIVLLFVCCIGYAVAVICFGVANCFDYCFRDYDDDTKMHTRSYMDGTSRNNFDEHTKFSRRSRRTVPDILRIEDDNFSRATSHQFTQPGQFLAIEEEGDFTVNSYETRSMKRSQVSRDPTMYIHGHGGRDPTMYIPDNESKLDPTMYESRNVVGRDPTMYVPGREDGVDPDYDSEWTDDDSALPNSYYKEDPPLTPKREPTMYVDGMGFNDQKQHSRNSPSIRRDQPKYSVYDDSTACEEVHNDYHHHGLSSRHSELPTASTYAAIPEDASLSLKSFRSVRSKKSTRSTRSSARQTQSFYH